MTWVRFEAGKVYRFHSGYRMMGVGWGGLTINEPVVYMARDVMKLIRAISNIRPLEGVEFGGP
jgi:hypothetical protein